MDTGAARVVRSFCRVCTSVCGILVEIDGDHVLAVHGDGEHPFSRGYTCPKGRALPQIHHHPDRLEQPMLRIDGQLTETSWETCLDDLGTRLREIIAEYGPAAVAINFGTGVWMDAVGYRTAEALHRAIGTPAKFSPLTIDGTAKVLVAELMGGSSGLTARPDYDSADLVILIGSNPVVSHGHTLGMPNPRGLFRELAKRAQLWVVDPRRTETARLATRHLAPRPGTDYAILGFLVREILRSGGNPDIPVQDVAALTAAVEPFTAEHTAALADVTQTDLDDLLAAVRRAGHLAIDTGTGVTMSASANVTQWFSWALLILTGSMNTPGGMWFHPGFGYQLESFELPIAPPEGKTRPGPRSRPETTAFMREWPCATLGDEIEAGNIRALINLGGNLLTGFPAADTLRPSLHKLEVLATAEILPTETTAMSTHVLPTKGQLERPDITLWDFMSTRISAQHTPAVTDPVGQRRSMWWVLAEIGKRLGHDVADPAMTDEQMLAALNSGGRTGYDDLVATGWAEAQRELPAAWVQRHVERLGGWRLAPKVLIDQLHGLRQTTGPVLVPRRQLRRLNTQLEFLGERAEVVLNPEDAAAAGVSESQAVLVRTEHGELTGVAKLDPSVRSGVVSVPHGHADANVNVLTSKDDLDPPTGMTRYSGLPVSVHPA
ncbi:molybdopterin-dependent oxidoreductase [Mycobacterium sp. CVI_P3]|uniref:Molybdopterin-dependent oxidoreductase n=1 Tax=Mycobacterium pinniadriaticum TaxID=2994102 RepID=A0ABT3SII2_9MYCO|nr:molybdopterin-dependent oxidoreductase [Mycobacterium pinniadriaticum]MCX2932895.1 molybdopterin-dependent oxidoreductase [Mycobacterium pinniadriaticum]MCX2939318.1 molybdopterin-dependent oxidoreductase [Mycobacterium pinniadriaticum]